jgi:hypothetical protein
LRQGGRVELTRDAVIAFGRQLRRDDEVVIEATVNTASIVRLLAPFVHRVVIANPLQVRPIAHAKIKTDKIDAGVWRSCTPAASCLRSGCQMRRPKRSGGWWRGALMPTTARRCGNVTRLA